MKTITRKDALQLGGKRYFTGKECPSGHMAERYCSSRNCVTCKTGITSQWYKDNPNYKTQWYMEHPTYNAQWRREHPNYDAERRASLEIKKRDAQSHALWCKNNAEKVNAHASNRRSRRLHATPSWLTKDHFLEIEGYYRCARTLTILVGVEYEVDHIHPLQGKTCCGLHVPWNLQVVPHEENARKHNKVPND